MTYRLQTVAFLLASLFILAASAAQAQIAEGYSGERVIRYTTGPVSKTGWEKPLVQKDHNLKNFYWMPITSIGQAYKKVPLPGRSAANQSANVQPVGSRYKKMNHVALPTNQNIKFDRTVSAGISTKNTDATLLRQNVEPMRATSYDSYKTTSVAMPALRSASVRGTLLH